MFIFNRKRLTSALATALLVGAQLLSPFSVLVPKVAADSYVKNGKITICHRTDSYSNPYEQITVDTSAADGIAGNSGNEADHYGEHQGPVFYSTIPKHTEWGDIIPPIEGVHNGLNWDAGHDIWNNDCNIPDSGSVTVNKCVDEVGNNQYICDNKLATSLGFQWSFDTATPSWNDMGSTVGGVAKGNQNIVENHVNNYSFTGWYETGDGHYSCTNPENTAQPVDITVKKDKTTEITLCNQVDPNGSITLIKKVIKDNGGTADVNDFGLSIGGTSVKSGDALSLPAGDYAINEVGKTGYNFVSITGDNCPAHHLGDSVSLASGENVTCTITNDDVAPSLTLVKLVNNDHGGDAKPSNWTLTATDTSGAVALSGQTGVTSGSDFKAGTYTLGEGNGPAGYTASSWTCTGGVTVTNSQITLTNGQSATCTITNSDIDPVLTVIKQVINPYGVAADPSYFPLFVDGASVTSGVPTVQQTGTHIVTETQQFGYIFRDATGDCTTDNNNVITVIIGVGDSKTCTLTNTAIQPKLIVVKHVVNDNGGTKHANDFTMTVSGNSATVQNFAGNEQGTTVYLNEGSYSVDELSHDGYTETLSDDCKGTITIGETKTCIITNDDMPASLKVVKVAYPESSQSFSFTSAELGDFSLVGDNSTDSSKTFDNLSSGTYVLSEQATDNWQNVYMECRNTDVKNYSISNNNLSITLSNGDNVTCYVYNLELNIISGHKFNDVNDNHVWDSGEPTLKNWTITLTGCLDSQEGEDPLGAINDNQACADQISRTTTTDAAGAYSFSGLEPGTYKVCEVQQANWTQTYPQTGNGCHEITIDFEQYGEVFTADFGNHPKPQVLGSSTAKLLVNTGMDASRNVIVGLIILGLLGSIHFIGARKKYNA